MKLARKINCHKLDNIGKWQSMILLKLHNVFINYVASVVNTTLLRLAVEHIIKDTSCA